MDMGRLIRFMAVEVKTVRTGSQHSRHTLSIPRREGLVRPDALDLGPLERPRPFGFTDGHALENEKGTKNGHRSSSLRSQIIYDDLFSSPATSPCLRSACHPRGV